MRGHVIYFTLFLGIMLTSLSSCSSYSVSSDHRHHHHHNHRKDSLLSQNAHAKFKEYEKYIYEFLIKLVRFPTPKTEDEVFVVAGDHDKACELVFQNCILNVDNNVDCESHSELSAQHECFAFAKAKYCLEPFNYADSDSCQYARIHRLAIRYSAKLTKDVSLCKSRAAHESQLLYLSSSTSSSPRQLQRLLSSSSFSSLFAYLIKSISLSLFITSLFYQHF